MAASSLLLAAALARGALAAAPPVEPAPDLSAPALAAMDLLTFNTWGLPAPIAASRRLRFPRIRRFLADAAPDVAALQEVWRGARSLLPLDGLRFPGHAGDSGLALLSRLPVLAQHSHTFRAGSGIDRLKDKGALLATVQHPALGPVDLVVTHLQAGRGPRAVAARAAQVDELLALVGAAAGPTVLLGDLNLYDDRVVDLDSSARLAAAGFVDAAAAVGATSPTHDREGQRLDRVYARGLTPQSAQVLPGAGLSDHRPVRVRLGPGPRPPTDPG